MKKANTGKRSTRSVACERLFADRENTFFSLVNICVLWFLARKKTVPEAGFRFLPLRARCSLLALCCWGPAVSCSRCAAGCALVSVGVALLRCAAGGALFRTARSLLALRCCGAALCSRCGAQGALFRSTCSLLSLRCGRAGRCSHFSAGGSLFSAHVALLARCSFLALFCWRRRSEQPVRFSCCAAADLLFASRVALRWARCLPLALCCCWRAVRC